MTLATRSRLAEDIAADGITTGPGRIDRAAQYSLPARRTRCNATGYGADPAIDELTAAVHAAAAAAVTASHEPVLTTYTADDISTVLHDAGFETVELMDAGTLRARYLSTRPDLLHSHSTLIAIATV